MREIWLRLNPSACAWAVVNIPHWEAASCSSSDMSDCFTMLR
ncbi:MULTISPECIES: hypothetical protein [Coriobacteriia]|nr:MULTISPECIES: hypothetical protein [Coriobacteriia]